MTTTWEKLLSNNRNYFFYSSGIQNSEIKVLVRFLSLQTLEGESGCSKPSLQALAAAGNPWPLVDTSLQPPLLSSHCRLLHVSGASLLIRTPAL